MSDLYNPDNKKDKSSNALTYNPKTRKWESSFSGRKGSYGDSKKTPPLSENSNGSESSNISKSKVASKEKAEKEIIEQEFNTLKGELDVVPNKTTLSLRVGDTVVLNGFGKYLSGRYFIAEINRHLEDGFSLKFSVVKTGFGDNIKSPNPNISDTTNRKEVVNKKTPKKRGGK